MAAVSPLVTIGGGFVVPKLRSYDVTPVAVQDSESEVAEIPVPLLAGAGDAGVDGGPAVVVNDHTEPTLDPLPFLATTCQ